MAWRGVAWGLCAGALLSCERPLNERGEGATSTWEEEDESEGAAGAEASLEEPGPATAPGGQVGVDEYAPEPDPADPKVLHVPVRADREAWVLAGSKALLAGEEDASAERVRQVQALFADMASADAALLAKVVSVQEIPDPIGPQKVTRVEQVVEQVVAARPGLDVGPGDGWVAYMPSGHCAPAIPAVGTRWLALVDRWGDGQLHPARGRDPRPLAAEEVLLGPGPSSVSAAALMEARAKAEEVAP